MDEYFRQCDPQGARGSGGIAMRGDSRGGGSGGVGMNGGANGDGSTRGGVVDFGVVDFGMTGGSDVVIGIGGDDFGI